MEKENFKKFIISLYKPVKFLTINQTFFKNFKIYVAICLKVWYNI